jgi:hypothetical protein
VILLRDHFAAPPDLDIRLVQYKVWAVGSEGVYLHTLWSAGGRFYMCDHVVHQDNPPFWDDTRMSDLIECSYVEFLRHAEQMEGKP